MRGNEENESGGEKGGIGSQSDEELRHPITGCWPIGPMNSIAKGRNRGIMRRGVAGTSERG